MSEVGGEEIREGGDAVVLGVVIGVLAGEGRLEEDGSLEAEALQVRVEELACGVDPGALEGVAGDHGRVGVV